MFYYLNIYSYHYNKLNNWETLKLVLSITTGASAVIFLSFFLSFFFSFFLSSFLSFFLSFFLRLPLYKNGLVLAGRLCDRHIAAVCCVPKGTIYQLDGPPLYFFNIVLTFLDQQFPARRNGKGSTYITWATRSSDPKPLDFSCGCLLSTRSTGPDLSNIQEIIYAAVKYVITHGWRFNTGRNLDISRATNGSHVEVYWT